MLSPYQEDDDPLAALRKATGINQPTSTSPIAGPQPLTPQKPPSAPQPGTQLNEEVPSKPPQTIDDGGATGGGGAGAPVTTFTQLQAAGIARPAPPPTPMDAPMPSPGQELGDAGQVTPQMLGGALGYQPSLAPPTGAPTGGGGTPGPVMPPATPQAPPPPPTNEHPIDDSPIPPAAPPAAPLPPPPAAPPPAAPPPVDQPPPGTTGGTTPPPDHPIDDPNSPGGTGQNGDSPPAPTDNPPPPPADNPPPGDTGNTGNNNNGGNNQTPGKYPLQDEIEAALKKALGQPSAYDDAAFQNDVGREYNKIDDQYALDQKGLTDELGQRGLGTSNDSSIGLGRLSDLNVGRKSARETVLSNLSSQRARSQSDDLARVLGLATSYGQGSQQLSFEQQMAIATLLAQLGYKPGQGVGG